MGNHPTLIFEFPIPEAITALLYHLFGPHIVYARLTTLLFFLGAAYYLSAIVRQLSTTRIALVTALVYLALPLGLFYSRAVLMDFCAVFFAHAMTYYFVRGYDERKVRLWFVGSIAGGLAFVVKAPYVFYLCIPCAYYVLSKPDGAFLKRGAALWAIAPLAFALWRSYASVVNAAAPDWSFIPGYFKIVDANMGWYYYGAWSLRLEAGNWVRLGHRMLYYVASPIGCITFALGLLGARRSRRDSMFFVCWTLGVLTYLLVFFNLNVEHDYYSIPFLAVIAFFTARFLDSLADGLRSWLRELAWVPVAVILLALAGSSIRLIEKAYYSVDWVRVRAGEVIERETPPGSLIVAASPETNFTDPRLLYLSKRNGWSIEITQLTPNLVESLQREGAQYLAVTRRCRPRTN